jgi:hypothetical protein
MIRSQLRTARFRSEREASGYYSAEALGQLIVRNLAITPAGVATIVCAEQIFAMVGVLATDALNFTNRASATQAGAGVLQGRVTSAGNVGISWVNPTVAMVTPTAETYVVGLYRR